MAEYLTELPPREVLEQRFHRAIESARSRLAVGSQLARSRLAVALDKDAKRRS